MEKKPGSATQAWEPVADPRFAGETPEERRARGQRAYQKLIALRDRKIRLDIDIDELRGRKRS